MGTTNFNMDAYEQALEKKIKEVCGEMIEGLVTTKEQKTVKPRKLSIKGIKEELVNAFLDDMRIINSFTSRGEIKTQDFIGTNIFGFLDVNDEMYTRTDSYIYFDVTERKDPDGYLYDDKCYDISIQIKVHKDLMRKEIVNKLDNMSFYVEDVVKELYPYHLNYANKTEGIKSIYARRNISFTLSQKNEDMYV